MRPDPQEPRRDGGSESIIYLGDVRKRRRSRARAPDRHYLAALAVVGAVSWTAWLLVATNLAPARLLTYIAFFLPLTASIFATATLLSYAAERRLRRFPSLTASARRGALTAALITVNLALQAAHEWNPLIALATVAVVLAANLLVERRISRGI
jgi:hypothetical protein